MIIVICRLFDTTLLLPCDFSLIFDEPVWPTTSSTTSTCTQVALQLKLLYPGCYSFSTQLLFWTIPCFAVTIGTAEVISSVIRVAESVREINIPNLEEENFRGLNCENFSRIYRVHEICSTTGHASLTIHSSDY